jgi:comEA protein
VRPEHAVISCARGNSFGHPAPETLERLKKTKAQVWRTDRDGGIVFRTDGQSIDVEPGVTRFVPAPAATAGNGTQPAAAPPARVIPASGSGGAAIDLNAATEADLDALPGIGPSKARAIIEWRERNGPFTSVDQLDEVKGIGPALLEKIRPHVSVGPRPGAGTPAPAAAAAPGPAADTDLENEAPTGKVNINTAGVEELQTLQSVGPALAQRIIDHRRAHGPFRRIADLDAVKGVGASFLEKNKYFIAVKVDVNAAAEAELRAVGLSEKTARALVEARKTKPLRSAAELRALVPEAEWKAAGGLLWTGG